MKEESINIFLNSRKFTVAILLFAIIATVLNFMSGIVQPIDYYGLCFPSANLWISNPLYSLIVNSLGVGGILVMLLTLNKSFNFMKGDNWIFVTLTLFIISCFPRLSTYLHDGTLFCLITLIAAFLLFSVYQAPQVTRRIYLLFTIITCAGLFQYAYLTLIPIFIIGLLQMHAFSLKGVIAIIFGVITPLWCLMGLGVIGFDDFVKPSISGFFEGKEWQKLTVLAIYIGGLIIIGFITWGVNLLQIFKYKLQLRAYNGFFTLLFFYSILMIAVDYNNMFVYLPLLVTCVAIQIGHSFTIFTYKRRYVLMLLFMIAYLSLFITRILL